MRDDLERRLLDSRLRLTKARKSHTKRISSEEQRRKAETTASLKAELSAMSYFGSGLLI